MPQTPAVDRHNLLGDLVSNDYPGLVPGPAHPGTSTGWLLECPVWCDGQHEVDDRSGACHSRVVAQRGDASVTLSCVRYHDQADTGSTVIILDADATAGPTEVGESDAIRLLGVIEAKAGGTSWLSGALRSALELLDPGAGWARPLAKTGVLVASPRENRR